MEKYIETKFKPCDDILEQLVAARREEVVQLQKSQAEQLNDLETRGQERIAALKKSLPKEFVSTLDNLDKTHDEASDATKAHVDRIKAKLTVSVFVSRKRNCHSPRSGRRSFGGA